MKVKFFALALIVSTYSVVEAQTLLGGRLGKSTDYNVAWMDLQTPTNLLRGSTLEFSFIGGQLSEIVVRFVPKGCPYNSPCMIDCEKIPVSSGLARIVLKQDYNNIIQISAHSGIGGLAFQCPVNGGAMPNLATITVRQ